MAVAMTKALRNLIHFGRHRCSFKPTRWLKPNLAVENSRPANAVGLCSNAAFSSNVPSPPPTSPPSTPGVGRKGHRLSFHRRGGDYRPWWRRRWDAEPRQQAQFSRPSFSSHGKSKLERLFTVKCGIQTGRKIASSPTWETGKSGTRQFDGVYLDIVDGFETFEQDGDGFHR